LERYASGKNSFLTRERDNTASLCTIGPIENGKGHKGRGRDGRRKEKEPVRGKSLAVG